MKVAPLVLAILTASACGGRSGGLPPDAAADLDAPASGGDDVQAPLDAPADVPLPEPDQHRPTATACPRERGSDLGSPPAECGPTTLCTCTTDADCTRGTNGRCLSVTTPAGRLRQCSYDECFADGDCPGQGVCSCRAGGSSAPNRCLADSRCRVDRDCGPAGSCSPSAVGCSWDYFCHTPYDTCVNAQDCAPLGPAASCAYDPAQARWRCQLDLCPDAG